jgi:hypothetical protein
MPNRNSHAHRKIAIACSFLAALTYLSAFTCRYSPRFSWSDVEPTRPPAEKPTRDSSPIKFLTSRLNFWGLYDTIDYGDLKCFNPSMISLPSSYNASKANLLSVTRDPVGSELRNGTKVSLRTVRAALLDIDLPNPGSLKRTGPRNYPRTKPRSITKLEGLVTSEKDSIPECSMYRADYHNILGPEDGRVFWSALGEPLMIYNSPSPINSKLCRILYIVDLRVIYPHLEHILLAANHSAPIRLTESVPLLIRGQEGLQKNWAPFTNAHGDIFIHYDIYPQAIYRLNVLDSLGKLPTFASAASDLVTLDPVVVRPKGLENCVTRILHDINSDFLHQSSPFIEVVRCTHADINSGACDPSDPSNRLYMGVFHVQHKYIRPTYYEPRIVTLNSTWPYNYVSVSKPLVYGTPPVLTFAPC